MGPDKLYKQSLDSAISSLLALISREYVTACPAHQQFIYARRTRTLSGSAVSELIRYIHHIITYVVLAIPRVINWARAPNIIQNHQSHVHVCMQHTTHDITTMRNKHTYTHHTHIHVQCMSHVLYMTLLTRQAEWAVGDTE